MPTAYVIFDGDTDMWAYRFMRGWSANQRVNFQLEDAHDIGSRITDLASEPTIRRRLRERLRLSDVVIVLVGDSTRHLYKFVRWELEIALDLELPIIVANLGGVREYDEALCPPILRGAYAVHLPYKARIISYALANFPAQHKARRRDVAGPLSYPRSVYRQLDIADD